MLQNISERYQIQQEIGAGGMGTVYLGLDKQSKQNVAIKALKKELTQPEMLERFKREGQALRELNHPNIVKLLDTLDVEGQYYLVMEYIAAGDLRQLLQNGKLPYQRCLNIAIDLADALTRAHRLNIIHRDLKPANVLVAEDGTIRLTDFGVAHVVDKERVTETNAIIGTLDYLPPEVLNGEAVEPRSDIWAFGVMLFEMLAGQRPFNGTGYLQILQAIATVPIPDLEALAPDAPTALVDLVYRMLNRDPQARISSVRHIGAELEDILQGRAKQSRFEVPASFNPPQHNFPVQVTDFVGREEELRQIARFYGDTNLHLLTIVGQGGMGKTRLMLEVAWRLMSENIDLLPEYPSGYKDGGYFIELAPLRTLDEVIAAIAQGLGYQFQNDERSQKQQILDYLKHKELGLLLDNFEHIMEASSIVAEIMQTAPHVRIAVTSRERLNLPGEQVFQLKGIEYPDTGKLLDAPDYPAVKLFLQTAKRVNPAYEMQNGDLAGIVEICKLAEGLPLAIILAASWLEMLSVQEVLAEMQKSIDFLASNSRGTVERHRSIRAVFEYSWRLLSEAEQDVFPKLSIFRGGFTREAAEAVTGANLRILMSLVNKSLLRRNNTTGRYEIHELLRQYAEEKGDVNAGRDAHSKYFLDFLTKREGAIKGHNQDTALNEIELDYENIVLAWQFAVKEHYYDLITPCIEALRWYADFRTQYRELRLLLEHARNSWVISTLPSALRCKLLCGTASSLEEIESALSLAREHNLPYEIAQALFQKWWQLLPQEDSFQQNLPILEECYQIYRSLNDNFYVGWILYWIGYSYRFLGLYESAINYCNQSIEILKQQGNDIRMAYSLTALGIIQWLSGNSSKAFLDLTEALEIFQRMKNRNGVVYNLTYIGLLKILDNQHEEAQSVLNNARAIGEKFYATGYDFAECISACYALLNNQRFQPEWLSRPTSLFGEDYWYYSLVEYHKANYDIARKYNRKMLRLATRIKSITIQLLALSITALIDYKLENYERATLLTATVSYHQNPTVRWLDYLEEFRILQSNISHYKNKAFAEAFERGKSLDIETVIQQILAESE